MNLLFIQSLIFGVFNHTYLELRAHIFKFLRFIVLLLLFVLFLLCFSN